MCIIASFHLSNLSLKILRVYCVDKKPKIFVKNWISGGKIVLQFWIKINHGMLSDWEQETGFESTKQSGKYGQREAQARRWWKENFRWQRVLEAEVGYIEWKSFAVWFAGECFFRACLYWKITSNFEMDINCSNVIQIDFQKLT